MSKQAIFTMKLEAELREQFMAEAEASHRPASQIVREMMRQFVQSQRESREYEAFLQHKVDAARVEKLAGSGLTNDEVEAQFAARRAGVTHRR
ncbi:antitoxin of toxin-antitoxin stability system [Pseudomonas sp. TMB3-21]